MSNVVIAGYVRSPFHPAYRGALAKVRPDDLAANTIRGLVERTGVKAEDIEDVVMGCAFPEGEQGFNIGRLVALLAALVEGGQRQKGFAVIRYRGRGTGGNRRRHGVSGPAPACSVPVFRISSGRMARGQPLSTSGRST